MPPPLKWESQVWDLYQTMINQRISGMGWSPINYDVLIPAIERKGWDIDHTLQLFEALFVAETKELTPSNEQ